MRIGDVGTVSHVGDLLAFSLAVILVLSLIFQVGEKAEEAEQAGNDEWVSLIISLRSWEGFDQDNDGIIDLDGIHERLSAIQEPFPTENEVHVSFLFEGDGLELHFLNGTLASNRSCPMENALTHGCSVLVEQRDSIIPCLMEISIAGGIK